MKQPIIGKGLTIHGSALVGSRYANPTRWRRLLPNCTPHPEHSTWFRVLSASSSSNNNKTTLGSLSSSSSSSSPWQRTARAVKNTTVSNQYLEHIRETHDPSLHLKTLEDEIRGTIGKALGKQGAKIRAALAKMEEERRRYHALLQQQQQQTELIQECIRRHNQYRQEAITARWELLVHRQAVGFIVNNHNVVMESFPIGDAIRVVGGETSALEIHEEDHPPKKSISSQDSKNLQASNKKFETQLEWWQRVGRWR